MLNNIDIVLIIFFAISRGSDTCPAPLLAVMIGAGNALLWPL